MEPLDMDSFPHRGEFDVERRALAGGGANINFSSVLFDYTVADREPQTGAASARFGGEKWIENAMNVFARNSRASVHNFHFDAAIVRAGADNRKSTRLTSIHQIISYPLSS